jgi:hypothetical protein
MITSAAAATRVFGRELGRTMLLFRSSFGWWILLPSFLLALSLGRLVIVTLASLL